MSFRKIGIGGIAPFFCAVFAVAQETPVVRGFVSVEPHELRVEALIEANAFAKVLGLDDSGVVLSDQLGTLSQLSALFQEAVTIKKPKLDANLGELKSRFVLFDSEKGFVSDQRDPIPLDEALIGLTWSFGVSGVDEVDIDWDFFGPEQERVAIEVVSSGAPSGRFVTPGETGLLWKSVGGAETTPEEPVPSIVRVTINPLRGLRWPSIFFLGLVAGAMIKYGRKSPPWVPWFLIVGTVGLVASTRVTSETVQVPRGEKLEDVAYGLLKNVYRSFEFRDESVIYDELEKSIEGTLLERVYLEIRESLELENAGGPRVRVYEVALRECVVDGAVEDDSVWTRAEWVTVGEVTHWGHTHERTNKYEARFRLNGANDRWKISELELLSEEREQKVSRREAVPRE